MNKNLVAIMALITLALIVGSWLFMSKSSEQSYLVLESDQDSVSTSPSLQPMDDAYQPIVSIDQEPQPDLLIVRGVIQTAERPAPDIAYDYQIELISPIYDPLNASYPDLPISSLVIIPKTEIQERELVKNLGNEVTVSGYLSWGYAESRPLVLESIVVD
jgi:hypothetical protein